jgi:hypothetical protein
MHGPKCAVQRLVRADPIPDELATRKGKNELQLPQRRRGVHRQRVGSRQEAAVESAAQCRVGGPVIHEPNGLRYELWIIPGSSEAHQRKDRERLRLGMSPNHLSSEDTPPIPPGMHQVEAQGSPESQTYEPAQSAFRLILGLADCAAHV